MSTATEGSPTKKRKEGKDPSDANGSYPYPQHYGYGGPPGGYGYPPPHQPTPPHYQHPSPSNGNYRGPQHPQSYPSSAGPPNGMYCQTTNSESPYTSGGYRIGQPSPYNRGPSGMYANNAYNKSASNNRHVPTAKSSSRSSPPSRPERMMARSNTSSTVPTSNASVSVSNASTSMRKATREDEKGRGSYRCGKCGVPKKGHICPYQPKLKRRADEPPPEMRSAATQVEMDEFLVIRRLNLEIQGFPESYTAAPLGDVGMESRPPSSSVHSQHNGGGISRGNGHTSANSNGMTNASGSMGIMAPVLPGNGVNSSSMTNMNGSNVQEVSMKKDDPTLMLSSTQQL